MQLALIDHGSPRSARPEDWLIQVNGQCYGYLYRCDQPAGYAVGIGRPGQPIRVSSIEASKAAALAYAEQQIGLLIGKNTNAETAPL